MSNKILEILLGKKSIKKRSESEETFKRRVNMFVNRS